MALVRFKHSPLPNPPPNYDPQYIRQFMRTLELYFGQLDSLTPNQAQSYTADEFIGGNFTGTNVSVSNLVTSFLSFQAALGGYLDANGVRATALISGGHRNERQISGDISAGSFYGGSFYGDGRHINTPYNQFQSDTDQTAANTYTAYAITYDTTDFADGITLSNSSHINVTHEGVYKFDYSVSLENTTNDRVDVDIWFRKNGNDIADSNSRFSVAARKSTGDPSYLIAVTPYMVELAANDYVQIIWRVSDVGVTIQHLAAVTANPGVTPAIPATPSVLLSVQFVSAKFPVPTYVAPLPVFGFGQIGNITVSTP